MYFSIKSALDKGCRRVVLVGTDIPAMRSGHLKAAFEALDLHDVVLGPSRDGGYWLIGMRKPVDIFQNIEWGSTRVLAQTLAAVRHKALSWVQLNTLNDIDSPEDLDAWLSDRNRRFVPYLSIVIPTLNEAAHIQATIEHVQSVDTQIIVVDGGSSDGTAALAAQSGALVLHSPRGRALQQNMGARHATGRVLLFLHADTRLPSGFEAQVFDLLMDPKVVLGAFHFKTDYRSRSMRLIEKAVHLRSSLLRMPYGDQALFMPRAVFEQAGGFDPVPIAEDLFLVRRLARMGRVALAPGAALTSGRRWRSLGVLRATLINYMIGIGCLAGVDPGRMAGLYAPGRKKKNIRTEKSNELEF
jgi:rSAM/selenodomain-associated transferase 2